MTNPTGKANEASTASQFVTFSLDQEQYGVDINAVREIKGWTKITPLPNQPDYVRGVLNLRGAMIPIIDLRCRFGQGMTSETSVHVVIVVQLGEVSTGILVDRVLDIVSIETKDVQRVPDVVNARQAAFLAGLVTVGETMIALVNLEPLTSVQGAAVNNDEAARAAA